MHIYTVVGLVQGKQVSCTYTAAVHAEREALHADCKTVHCCWQLIITRSLPGLWVPCCLMLARLAASTLRACPCPWFGAVNVFAAVLATTSSAALFVLIGSAGGSGLLSRSWLTLNC